MVASQGRNLINMWGGQRGNTATLSLGGGGSDTFFQIVQGKGRGGSPEALSVSLSQDTVWLIRISVSVLHTDSRECVPPCPLGNILVPTR